MVQENQPVPVENKNSKRYLLQHDRPNCIGCAACEAIAPDFWEMNGDGKSDIKNSVNSEKGWQERDIDDSNLNENKDAADSCPVNVIHLTDKKSGERLI
jgi:ferredoxin